MISMNHRRIEFQLMPWNTPISGVRSKTHQQAQRQIRLVEFAREFVEPDWCQKGHIGYVLEGEAELDFDGEKVLVSAGDGIMISPGEADKHKMRVLTEVLKVVLVEDIA